jgi:hypothetical protein
MTTRVKIRAIAILISLAYTAARVLIVQATLVSYGINPWVFLIIDAISGVVYVLGIEQLIVAMKKRNNTPMHKIIIWSLVTIAMFAAPYLYLFGASRELPWGFAIGLGLIVVLLLVNATLSFRRRVQRQSR